MDNIPCSIIIPMHNSEKYIDICLKSILESDYDRKNYEVIVVDNMSTDKSVELADKYPVNIIRSYSRTIAGVRNDGASIAKGDVLAFIDSDCKIHKNWLKVGVEILKRDKVGATGSGYEVPEDASWVEIAWLYEVKNHERFVKFVPSGNMMVNTRLFRELNGFDGKLKTCEDADLCERIIQSGYKILNSSYLLSVHLRNPKTIRQFFKKERWYGYNTAKSVFNGNIDKVFIFTLLTYAAHIIFLSRVTNGYVARFSIIALLMIINIAVVGRISISKKYKQYHKLALLYYVYFMARGLGMIDYLLDKAKLKAASYN